MKASVYTKYGPPEVLQVKEVSKPTPKPKEILIKVFAATVNRTDCAMLRAKPFIMRFFTGLFKPKKSVLGTDFAGQIAAIGTEVTSFKVGDKVFGFDDAGSSSHAEYLTISVSNAVITLPENTSYEQATASIEGAHYAYNFLNKVTFKKGQHVLVNGATGAIGSAGVQLLKNWDVDVTAVCAKKDSDLVISLGADTVIDYTSADFTKTDKKFDFVFDMVGKSSFGKCKSILKPHGIYISSELGAWSQNLFYTLATPLFGGKKVRFPFPFDKKGSLLYMKQQIEDGRFKAVIDRTLPLEQIAEAFRYVETGQKIGNVVIRMT